MKKCLLILLMYPFCACGANIESYNPHDFKYATLYTTRVISNHIEKGYGSCMETLIENMSKNRKLDSEAENQLALFSMVCSCWVGEVQKTPQDLRTDQLINNARDKCVLIINEWLNTQHYGYDFSE